MKILFDGTTLSKKIDGLTQYSLNVLLELIKFGDDFSYDVIYRKNNFPSDFDFLKKSPKLNFIEVNIAPIGPKRDFQFWKFYKKNKRRYDLVYIPSAQYPICLKNGIYTIHDLLYEEYPEKLGKLSFFKKLYLHFVVHIGLKKSSQVITVSNFSESQILKFHKFFKKYKSKVSVIYEGYEHLKLIKPKEIEQQTPYFIYIGSSRGHKNLSTVFNAYLNHSAEINTPLLVVGNMNRLLPFENEIVQKVNAKNEIIRFTGWIENDVMYGLLKNAKAFIFPSKSEGFGIPILESYFFNVPLICSDIPVFNEVCGDACIKFNPLDSESIATTLIRFNKMQKKEIDNLIKLQAGRLENFSWKSTAAGIYKVLKKINTYTNKCVGRGGVVNSFDSPLAAA